MTAPSYSTGRAHTKSRFNFDSGSRQLDTRDLHQIRDLETDMGYAFSEAIAEYLDDALEAADVVRQSKRALNLRDVVTPSGVNDVAAVNAALAAFDDMGGGVLEIPADDWVFTGATGLSLLDTANPIHIFADPGTVFDMTDCTASIGLSLGGSLGASAPLDNDVEIGSETIDCELAVSVGDVLRIQSTDLWSPHITALQGEMVEVLSSDGATIVLSAATFGEYSAATTTVTLMKTPRVSVSGLTILRDGNVDGLQVQYARDVALSDLYAEGARYALMRVSNVFGATVMNCRGRDFFYEPNGTSYGLSIASSQHVVEIGNDFRGGRHGVMHGGTFPCRDIQVLGGTVDNHPDALVPGFDFHGNVENVRVIGVTMLSGLTSGASNAVFDSCTMRTSSSDPLLALQLSAYVDCDYIRIRNCDVKAWHSDATAIIVTNRGCAIREVEVTGTIEAGEELGTGVLVQCTETGSIDKLRIGGNIKAFRPIRIVPGIGGDVLTVDETHVSGRVTAQNHGVWITNTDCGRLFVENAEILVQTEGVSPLMALDAAGCDITVRNSRLAGDGVLGGRNFFGTGKHAIIDSEIDYSTNGGVSAATAEEILLSNVRVTNTAGAMILPDRFYVAINIAGDVITQGFYAPTVGAWNVGDRCINFTPALGGVVSWVCVVAGTPGTWIADTYAGTPTASSANLANVAHVINTADKYAGKTVFNTTTNKLVTAVGAAAGDAWYDQAGASAHSPV